jgi:hypothetical protein
MKSRKIIKLSSMGIILFALATWVSRYNELTSLALVFFSLIVILKLVGAIIYRKGRPPGGNGGRGPHGINPLVPRPPGRRPPVLSAAAELP